MNTPKPHENTSPPSARPSGSAIDCEHRDWPICPHCGRKICGPEDLPVSVDDGMLDCDACGGDCMWERHVTITYSTRLPNNAELRRGGEKQRL